MKLLNYIVFSGSHPSSMEVDMIGLRDGGWNDYKGTSHSLEKAYEIVLGSPHDWWQIVDTRTGKIAKSSSQK